MSGSRELLSSSHMLSLWWQGHCAVVFQPWTLDGRFPLCPPAEQDSVTCCSKRDRRESLRVLPVPVWQWWGQKWDVLQCVTWPPRYIIMNTWSLQGQQHKLTHNLVVAFLWIEIRKYRWFLLIDLLYIPWSIYWYSWLASLRCFSNYSCITFLSGTLDLICWLMTRSASFPSSSHIAGRDSER